MAESRRRHRRQPLGGQSKCVKNEHLSVEQVSFYRWHDLGDHSSSDVSVSQGGLFYRWRDRPWGARSLEYCDLETKVDCTFGPPSRGLEPTVFRAGMLGAVCLSRRMSPFAAAQRNDVRCGQPEGNTRLLHSLASKGDLQAWPRRIASPTLAIRGAAWSSESPGIGLCSKESG